MFAASSSAGSECEQMLTLLSRFKSLPCVCSVLSDAEDIQKLLHLYSFRQPHKAEALAGELSSRYRTEILALYGGAGASRRQSENCYLRLEQLLSSLVRVAVMRLARAGALPLSHSQITQGDAMLLFLLERAAQNEKGG